MLIQGDNLAVNKSLLPNNVEPLSVSTSMDR